MKDEDLGQMLVAIGEIGSCLIATILLFLLVGAISTWTVFTLVAILNGA